MTIAITLIAVGKNKDKAIETLCAEYRKRLVWPLQIVEIAPPRVADTERKRCEAELITKAIPEKSAVICLDERGDNITSPQFARKIASLTAQGTPKITCIIGGADGLDDSLRQRAVMCLGFGQLTWPHMLVRVMLLEQLYRAQTILSGHPYHRA